MNIKLPLILFFIGVTAAFAQVGIGTTTPQAELDITSTSRGLLIPRVSLTNLTVQAPVINPQGGNIPESTLVYHDGTNSISAGFYYWDGTQWVLLTTGESSDWTILGNPGTNPTTNFIGTTDAQDFVIRTSNTEYVRLTAIGSLGIGTPTPLAKTHIAEINGASTNDALRVNNLGTGSATTLFQTNTTNNSTALYIQQDGTNAISRGIDTYMGVTTPATGYSLFHDGLGRGTYTDLTNAANAATGSAVYHAGTGRGSFVNLSNTANTSTASAIIHEGTGNGEFIALTNATGAGTILSLDTDGTGRGQQIALNNAANADVGLLVVHAGSGTGVQSQTVGNAVVGITSGISGTAGTFVNTNANADRNGLALFANYSGIGGGAAGGGNAAEISHFGTNGNAVDIFMGDPTAGAAASTSEYSALSVSHSATGTSPTAGLFKSAITASNNSADPTILVNNNGTNDGDGVQIFVTPNANANTTGTYSQSVSGALGTGVFGVGGEIGVIGQSNSGGFGLFANGDVGATGLKPFTIDYPLDPENKTLRHFAIESNEVLNMYRGVIKMDGNGNATVLLPAYFNEININISYQLTPIGSSTQPFISKECTNNQFSIKGEPNTKVSWTIYAERNDPVVKYYRSKNKYYSSDITQKKTHEIGKYYTPEVYGKDKKHGIFYNKEREKNYSERAIAKRKLSAYKYNKKELSLKENKKEIDEKEENNRKVSTSTKEK